MLEKLEEIKNKGLDRIRETNNIKDLEDIKRELLGKKSSLTDVLKLLGTLDAEMKKKVGMRANEIKKFFDEKLKEREEEIINNTSVTDEKIDKKYRKYSLLYFFLVWNYEYLCIRQAASQHNSQASLELLHSICIIFA